MKRYLLLLAIIVSSCSPSEAVLQTAIAETLTSAPTLTLPPTETPIPMPTITTTSTKRPTLFPTKTPVILGQFNTPFNFDSPVPLVLTVSGDKVEFIIRIKKMIRGQEAWSAIYQANMFNDAPPNGMEAIMVQIYVKNISNSGFLSLDEYDFSIVSKGQVIDHLSYSPCCLNSAGYIEFEAKLNPGGEFTGWIASMVNEDENNPLIVLGADRNGRGGMYFSLTRQ